MNKNPMFNYMIIREFLHAFQAINEWLLTIFSLSWNALKILKSQCLVLKVFDINDLFEAKNILYWTTDVDAEGRAFELKGGSLLYITFTTISIFLYMQNLLPENLYASTFLN